MKQAILYIGHGSRLTKAQKEAAAFLESCKQHMSAPIQEISFLELAEPDIETGFKACAEKGATHIAAVPLLLLTAAHAKQDIPEEIARASSRYPSIHVTYGKPIGVDQEVVKAVFTRIEETGVPYEHARVVLIGRGSSDPDVKRDITKIAARLKALAPVAEVIPCFMTACAPNYLDVFAELKESGGKTTFIVPYLLFTGMLMNEIKRETEKLKEVNPDVVLSEYLGFHPHVKNAFLNRVKEAVSNQDPSFVFKGAAYASPSH
ncbi:sirohydrochlorin chelatase [Bacillus sonorensis]|uniref:sirohydrochlorin chelatase n=1 Tax=Bacillus sonorensis TaxID=119858 RepID=UPI0018CDCE9E|nr:sirohydrochlorin chelatase [Bacillus sonorensis]MBG9917058.1 sirohydrochlorin ferrochelatase [Bacillus sonorensis]MCY7855296.1 sirohydrochlorin chelatase [Bacillus sonorensis]MCY8032166.1 sirohydrochlorin chelatase [Bacillus sonorensis]MCY8086851.1 sirohydrochlorin chelatase [Bacillus sonorensis]MCY8271021.1 sirohydrochlorin chelatase [Bacillus sonorensis]